MADIFGQVMGMGMNPGNADLYKQAKKRLGQGTTPMVPKKDGSVGPGAQNAPKPDNIWSRIVNRFEQQRQF